MNNLLDDFESDYGGTPWPCAASLLAGTLALMTRWAAPDPTELHRDLIARKIVSNLFFLREHPHLPAGLRLVSVKLHAAWSDIALGAARSPATMLPTAAAFQ